jgi:hypothetical protein
MKHNRPALQKWAYRLSRALIAVLWLAHDTGCLLPDVTLKDQDSGSIMQAPDAGRKQSTGADTSSDTGVASSSNSPPAVHGADTSTDAGAASNSNSPPAVNGADTSIGDGTLQLTYSPMYSAFVPEHEAQLPVTLKDTSLRSQGAKFSSSDPTVATVSDTEDGATITVKKAGVVTIVATLDGHSGTAKLTIKPYTNAQWMTGQARFAKSELAIVPKDGAAISAIALIDPTTRNANGACNTCHTAQAKTLKSETTPTQIAGYSDDELITIFTMGKKPERATQTTMIPSFLWGMFHTWRVTDEEKQGLVAFLRTQMPKANPAMIDYGVQACPGTVPSASGMTMLCDNNGKPINLPGTRVDAGVPRTP